MGHKNGSKEMYQKDNTRGIHHSNGSNISLVNTLMKSLKVSSSSSAVNNPPLHETPVRTTSNDLRSPVRPVNGSGNFDAMAKQQTSAIRSSSSYSPMRYSSPSQSNSIMNSENNNNRHTSSSYHENGSAKKSYNFSNNANGTPKLNTYFKDLDEDWSAVIDDSNMPIPTVANGGISRSNSDTFSVPGTPINHEEQYGLSKKLTNSSIQTSYSVKNTSSNQYSYPQLPQLQHTQSSELKSKLELENEREAQELNSLMQRIAKFDNIVNDKKIVNQQELRTISWNGIPKIHRPKVWKLLIGYLPANIKRQEPHCKRKRQEYKDGIDHIFSDEHNRDIPTWHQIEIDIPRTNPTIPLYQFKTVQNSLQRILYLWAIRHPASGYVQGINDIVTPFFQTFLTEYLPTTQVDKVETIDPATYMTSEQIIDLEADTFWCLTKLLEQITDNYIHGQPGIIKQVKNLSQLVKRIDIDLYNHFQDENVEFMQFAFRWMNCLLMREFKIDAVIRMWDTYLAETSLETTMIQTPMIANSYIRTPTEQPTATFQNLNSPFNASGGLSKTMSSSADENNRASYSSLNEFHVFVCAAFLIKWSDKLLDMDFQEIITFLQNPPTSEWEENDIEMLLSEAFIWQSLYKDATSHWL
ncbi:hypothetical protein TPHA_0J01400 [Tetrapisispora phaffii CBS 4417]|uniref:Rab-GAP TBC domain-containing protein n=1 Tax=Tetrapisispora phaffii (strain ATCC 24235 / CBS 4417 / NBRC 1672 / NRRL Y-8282 / UCD 70-5) TaxID=1071381 RepID=G8BYM0_TETPH|nr:hypothetical protein TPHA_0J01400 [Tetrapisispora phaffii CBS 4417]CCE64962.1 hypothetical protein TPHA_0J01400 [Tetrapisispora phaffii CBS 4417]